MTEQDELQMDRLVTRFKTEGKSYAVQSIQNVDPVAEASKQERLYGDNGFTDMRYMRKVGSIPNVFVLQDKYKDIIDGDQKAMEKAVARFFADHPEFKSGNGNQKYIDVGANIS